MRPYDKITIIRNRHRARDLRRFRELVEIYFERAEYADDMPVDWDGARAARSQINQMLPRAIQIVHAARLAGAAEPGESGPTVADVEVLKNIFSARYEDGAEQEILDVIDMALGVYEASRFNALARTVNPFHYVLSTLGFVAGLPRRGLLAIGLWPTRARQPQVGSDDIARIEAAVSRLATMEKTMEGRFREIREQQAQQISENAEQLADLAERLDFAERVLAQPRPTPQLQSPAADEVETPV